MAHDKVYGYCENLCKVEVADKEWIQGEVNTLDSRVDTLNSSVNTLDSRVDNIIVPEYYDNNLLFDGLFTSSFAWTFGSGVSNTSNGVKIGSNVATSSTIITSKVSYKSANYNSTNIKNFYVLYRTSSSGRVIFTVMGLPSDATQYDATIETLGLRFKFPSNGIFSVELRTKPSNYSGNIHIVGVKLEEGEITSRFSMNNRDGNALNLAYNSAFNNSKDYADGITSLLNDQVNARFTSISNNICNTYWEERTLTFSGGLASDFTVNLSSKGFTNGNRVGVNVTGVATRDAFAAAVTNSSLTSFTVAIRNLTNASGSATVRIHYIGR